MDRINGANTIDIGGGRRGFRDRNLVSGLSGTQVTAAHLNAVQEEVMGVIEAAGITPAAGNWTQLLGGLTALFGGGGSLVAPTGWQRLPGGMIVQWGFEGRAARTLSATANIIFPIPFPNACFVVIPTIDFDNAGLMDMAAAADTPSLTGVSLIAGTWIASGEGAEVRTFGWRWIALGR